MSECNWELLARFSQHEDQSAFTTLVDRHRRLVQATCRRILGDGSDADDATQATFLKLARNASQLSRCRRSQRSLACWLNRVATNTCVDMARSGAARRLREQEYVRRSASDAGPMTTRHMVPHLDELVAGLPPELREPIVLCYLQGLPHAQAAAELGITVPTLRRRIQSAKATLRSRYASLGIPASMFLLHMLLDKLSGGADVEPSPDPVAHLPAEPPPPTNPAPPPIRTRSIPRPTSRAATTGPAAWALKVGLIVAVIGTGAALHHLLDNGTSANAAVDVAGPAAPDDPQPIREPAAPAPADVSPPVMSSRLLEPVRKELKTQPLETPSVAARSQPEPEPADSPHQTLAVVAPKAEPPAAPEFAEPTSEVVEPVREPVEPASEVVEPAPQPVEIANAPAGPAVPPRNVEELFGIEWHTTLDSARAAAQQEPDKPIFCFRVLGELSGFM